VSGEGWVGGLKRVWVVRGKWEVCFVSEGKEAISEVVF